jgi:cell division protein FtsB
MNRRRNTSPISSLLLAGALLFAGYCLWQFLELRREYASALRDENAARLRLAAQQQLYNDSQRKLERLRTDPVYNDKIIRQRLGYARPGELIFRFEQTDDDSRPISAFSDSAPADAK